MYQACRRTISSLSGTMEMVCLWKFTRTRRSMCQSSSLVICWPAQTTMTVRKRSAICNDAVGISHSPLSIVVEHFIYSVCHGRAEDSAHSCQTTLNSITQAGSNDLILTAYACFQCHYSSGCMLEELHWSNVRLLIMQDDSFWILTQLRGQVTGGRNGYGAKLANIFSTEFVIETCDGKRQRRWAPQNQLMFSFSANRMQITQESSAIGLLIHMVHSVNTAYITNMDPWMLAAEVRATVQR